MARRNDMALAPGGNKWYGDGVNSENSMAIKHKFVSSVPDGADASEVRPSNWNAEHDLFMTPGAIMQGQPDGSGGEAMPYSIVKAGPGVYAQAAADSVTLREGPVRASLDQLYPSSGANAFGDLTAGGGLAAVFNGVTTAGSGACGAKAISPYTYAGQNCTAQPAIFSYAMMYGSNNAGFSFGAGATITATMYGKNGSAPVSYSDGIPLGILTFIDTADESGGRCLRSGNLIDAWDYLWCVWTGPGGNAWRVAELKIYYLNETQLSPRKPSMRYRDSLNIREIDRLAFSGQDDTATFNTMIDDINSGFQLAWKLPGGSGASNDGVSFLSAALTPITASYWSIQGSGYDTRIIIPATAGDVSNIFTIGDSASQLAAWLIDGLALEFQNNGSIVTPNPAIDVVSASRASIRNLRIINGGGGIKLGDSIKGGVAQQINLFRNNIILDASRGGLTYDLQSFAGIHIGFCNHSASGTAISAFRGLKAHPLATDATDTVKITSSEWNYPGPNPAHNWELDASLNHLASWEVINTVIDQAVSGDNIWIHADAGAVSPAPDRFINSILFENVISNGSTSATSLVLDNSAGIPFDMEWIGGQMSSLSTNPCVRAKGGNRIDANLIGIGFTRRVVGGAAVAAVAIEDGTSGIRVNGCFIKKRKDNTGTSDFDQYNYLVNFEGQATDCAIINNNAKEAKLGVVNEGSNSAANKAKVIIADNHGPAGPQFGRGALTFANLPSPTQPGHFEYVTDLTSQTYGAVAAGGGAYKGRVTADGSAWYIG